MQPTILKELSKIFTDIPFNRMLGLSVDAIEEDKIIMSFGMKDDLVGNFIHGILHGGVTSSVIDMAGGVAAMVSAMRKHNGKSLEELKTILSKSSTRICISIISVPAKANTSWLLHGFYAAVTEFVSHALNYATKKMFSLTLGTGKPI